MFVDVPRFRLISVGEREKLKKRKKQLIELKVGKFYARQTKLTDCLVSRVV